LSVVITTVSGSGAVMPVIARTLMPKDEGEFSTRGARQTE
jgi:hypothetical protein